jgi:2-amino-4-hydroxy-6-hydroxymethyldihydropteridine diphosphokinase
MAEALIGFGGNLGDVRKTLAQGVDSLCDGNIIRLTARSSDYRTPPWGVEDQPAFVNMCIAAETTLTPDALLGRGLEVERQFGRNRSGQQRWGPRSLDIDILAYDDVTLTTPALVLPHPRLLERAFILVPLAEIRPTAVIGGISVADALARLDTRGIERLPSPA